MIDLCCPGKGILREWNRALFAAARGSQALEEVGTNRSDDSSWAG
jgi:hypothetical protein